HLAVSEKCHNIAVAVVGKVLVVSIGYRYGGSRHLVPSIPQPVQVIVSITVPPADVIACRPPSGLGNIAVVQRLYHTVNIVLDTVVVINTEGKQVHRVRADAQVVHIVDVSEPAADVVLIVGVL